MMQVTRYARSDGLLFQQYKNVENLVLSRIIRIYFNPFKFYFSYNVVVKLNAHYSWGRVRLSLCIVRRFSSYTSRH